MSNVTLASVISVNTLILIMICCCEVIAEAQEESIKKSREFKLKRNFLHSTQKKQRVKRQIEQFAQFGGNGNNNFNNFNKGNNFNGGSFPRRRQIQRSPPASNIFFPDNNSNGGNRNSLIFSGGGNSNLAVTTPATFASNDLNGNNNINTGQLVFINNRPTIATQAPFTGRTTPSSQYQTCFNSCRTTSEYNPICGSDQELYFNEQKFNCARRCGADIQIVRRGSCSGLFPMMRG